MNSIIIYYETDLLICKDCKFALIPFRINTHFKDSPHKLKSYNRTQIENHISYLDYNDLVTHNREIKAKIQIFLQSFDQTSSISNLATYSDKVICSYCSYISRSYRST